ncbi:MAG: radical SAM protein [Syntrophobacteraceae bacterium]
MKQNGACKDFFEGEKTPYRPGYIDLYESGLLAKRAQALENVLESCRLCPRKCGANRLKGSLGACKVDARPKVAAINIHLWEEPPLSCNGGSGTIFFSGCTLECLFCQNYPISQLGVGRYMSAEDLASEMMKLQNRGAQNINFVTPTHQVAALVRAVFLAVPLGFRLPIVYNTSGYESLETLRLLEGIVDIYLPDIKYADEGAARFCSGRADYVMHNRAALLEMWRQVGLLQVDSAGIARRGLLIRHLVLPENLSGTQESMRFLAANIGAEVWVSLMNQYFPAHKALQTQSLDRKTTREEYERAFDVLAQLGIENGFVQSDPEDDLEPPFRRTPT